MVAVFDGVVLLDSLAALHAGVLGEVARKDELRGRLDLAKLESVGLAHLHELT